MSEVLRTCPPPSPMEPSIEICTRVENIAINLCRRALFSYRAECIPTRGTGDATGNLYHDVSTTSCDGSRIDRAAKPPSADPVQAKIGSTFQNCRGPFTGPPAEISRCVREAALRIPQSQLAIPQSLMLNALSLKKQCPMVHCPVPAIDRHNASHRRYS